MKKIKLSGLEKEMPAIIVGGMRLNSLDENSMIEYMNTAIEKGANYFDYADIYANGDCEERFGSAYINGGFSREDVFIQSKCGICNGYYDSSREHILKSVDEILKRMRCEYLDMLLIHRPDALAEPEEVAKAFDELEKSGKVRSFGVSNHNSMQIELLKRYVEQPLVVNQLQFSIPVSNLVAAGIEANMETNGAIDRDGHVLDYCRLNDITIQAWSPFQMPAWRGCFIGNGEYQELNNKLNEIAYNHSVSATAVATAWILRHPANMQVVAGTANKDRLKEIIEASEIELSRKEWYELYLAAGHMLP